MNKLRMLALLAVLCLVPELNAQNKQLVIFTWEDMFPDEVLDGFKQANPDIEIVYETFDSNESMHLILQSTDASNYDLVIADDYIIQLVIEDGMARKLDKSKLSNLGNVDPFYQGQFYDPRNEYTIPFGAGVQTIVYNPAKIPAEIKGYADLWSGAFKNRLGIVANYRVVNGMALKKLGKSYNIEDVDVIKAAGRELKALAPNIRYISDFSLDEYLINGDIDAAVMYTDQVMMAKQANPNLKVVFPKEGIGFGIMAGFIPTNASNPDAAYRFMNYILDAERGARYFESLGYYCTNKASIPFIQADLRQFLIMPSEFKNFEMIENFTTLAAEDEHNRIWGEFETAVNNR